MRSLRQLESRLIEQEPLNVFYYGVLVSELVLNLSRSETHYRCFTHTLVFHFFKYKTNSFQPNIIQKLIDMSRSQTERSSHFHSSRRSTISFRQYLLPKNVEQMTEQSKKSAYQHFDINILNAVGDASFADSKKTLKRRLIDKYKSVGKVIRPDNPWLIAWYVLLVLIIIYFIIQIGLLLGFGQVFWLDQYNYLFWLHIIFVLILLIDMLISPLKAFYEQGLLIKDVNVIFGEYIKVAVYIDAIGVFCVLVPLVTGNIYTNWIKVLWVVKFYNLDKINEQFQRMTQLYIILNTSYLVIKLVTVSIFYAHYMGILFYLVSLSLYNSNYYGPNTPMITWIYNSQAFYQMVFLSWWNMYVYIMYYSVAVVTTIAYGDVTPKNPIECLFTILALISQAILWGYILSQILRLLVSVYTYNFQRRYYHYQMNWKLKASLIKDSTFRRVQKHTAEIDRDQQYRNRTVEDQILSFLPPDPHYGLLLLIYKDGLKKIGFQFAQNLTYKSIGPADYKSAFLEAFMKEIKEQRHFAGDVLYLQKQIQNSKPDNHCAYFFTHQKYTRSVVLGIADHISIGLDQNQEKYVVIQKPRSFQLCRPERAFGVVQFLTGQARSNWAICLQNCLLFSVSRSSLLRHYQLLTLEERQSIMMSTQKIKNKRCLICHEQHNFLHCPYAFAASLFILQPTQNVRHLDRLKTHFRTRPKQTSSWKLFHQIRDIDIPITNQYKHRLYMTTTHHDLFVQLELEEDIQNEEEELQHQLQETQVIIDNLYRQELEELGLNQEMKSYQQVYNFKVYKTECNIQSISKKLTKLRKVKKVPQRQMSE